MSQDIYEKLARRMDKYPLGAPYREQLLDILRALFTPEEAELAIELPMLPKPLSELAGQLDRDHGQLERLLEGMADKGLAFCSTRREDRRYILLPLAPGIFETQFMKAEFSPQKTEIARLFNEYFYSGFGTAIGQIETPHTRVLSVEEEIPSEAEVLPYEKASQFIKESIYMAITNCFYRHGMELLGKACDAPKRVCMTFGPFAEYLVDRGFARRARADEMLEALRVSEEAGLVHLTDNAQEKINFLCNCCGCCCGFIRSITELEAPGVVASSGFLAVVEEDECTGCDICEERCQLGAITMEYDIAHVNPLRCIGCGICSSSCENEAMKLLRLEEVTEPPRTFRDLQVTLLKERGLL